MQLTGQRSTPYIVDILHQHGVEQVVICPGSRNAPFTLAFTRHSKFNCISIVDERSAGYFALGLAKASKKPVAIVCTSGTATLNFAPAIAEAYHQQIPLIVLTADRPEAWINQQDGQAIDQKNIYANIIAKSYHLKGELYNNDDLWFTERVVNEAFHIAVARLRPVHINISFAEPLYDESYAPVVAKKIDSYRVQAFFSYWSTLLKDKKNIMVLLGQTDQNDAIVSAVHELCTFSNVVVIAENLANVSSSSTIYNATEALAFKNDKMVPDAVIYLGGPIVSKQLKKYIASIEVPVIRVQQNEEEVDAFKQNVAVVQQTVVDALQALVDHFKENTYTSQLNAEWKLASEKATTRRNEYLSKIEFSDLKIFELLAKKIPADAIIHLANSTPVRYAQIFNDLYQPTSQFYSNRGTSGIDGSSSTAVGYSYYTEKLNFLITGDLSFQYDANAFFNKYLKGNLKLIVINNSGGNIFRVIDGPRDVKERDDYFETSIQHEFSNLSKHFHLNYFSAENEKDLSHIWQEFLKAGNNRPSVLEIFTDAEVSANTFKDLYKYLQQ